MILNILSRNVRFSIKTRISVLDRMITGVSFGRHSQDHLGPFYPNYSELQLEDFFLAMALKDTKMDP